MKNNNNNNNSNNNNYNALLFHPVSTYLDSDLQENNILKFAGSVLGLNHTLVTIEIIRASKLGRVRTKEAKSKISIASIQAQPFPEKKNQTGITTEFTSVRKAASHVGLYHSYIAKCLRKKYIYTVRIYTIVKK